jgi:hypothetical protein
VTGPAGPETHRGGAGDVGVAGDGPVVAEFAVASSDTRRGNGDAGREWRRCNSILSARSKRTARRSCSASRGSRGGAERREHGAAVGLGFGSRGEKNKQRERESKPGREEGGRQGSYPLVGGGGVDPGRRQ